MGAAREVQFAREGTAGVSLRGPPAHTCDSEEQEREGRGRDGAEKVPACFDVLLAARLVLTIFCVIRAVLDGASRMPVWVKSLTSWVKTGWFGELK